MAPEENKILSLVLAELRDTKTAVRDAVTRFEDDIDSLLLQIDKIEKDVREGGLSIEQIKELVSFKNRVNEILTYDDMKKIKEEREKSTNFRSTVTAYAIAYASVISLVVSVTVAILLKKMGIGWHYLH